VATQLYDPYGRIIEKPPSKPLTDMIGTVRVRDQWSTYPSVKLTPDRLASIFKEADAGDIIRQAELFEEMEEKDPDLASLFQTRKLAVQGCDLEVLPISESAEDKKIAAHVKENLDDLDLDEAKLDLLDAVAKGAAFMEINWQSNGKGAWATCLEWIHQKRFTYIELSAGWNEPLPKCPRLLTDKEPLRGEDVPPFKVIYHRYKARSGFAQRAGLMRTIAYYYLFKNYDIKDWVIFLEKFGQPMRLGIFEPGAGKDDIAVLKEAIKNLGVDAGAVISSLTKIDFPRIEGVSAHSDVYERFGKFVNESYAKAILGQTATTEGTPGKLGGEEARSEVRYDLMEADAKALAKTLRQQLVWPMVGFNFGFDKPLPIVRFPMQRPEDLTKLASVYTTLADGEAEIPLSHVRKKFGIPARNGDEPILKPRATPAPQFPQPPIAAALQLKKKVQIPIA